MGAEVRLINWQHYVGAYIYIPHIGCLPTRTLQPQLWLLAMDVYSRPSRKCLKPRPRHVIGADNAGQFTPVNVIIEQSSFSLMCQTVTQTQTSFLLLGCNLILLIASYVSV